MVKDYTQDHFEADTQFLKDGSSLQVDNIFEEINTKRGLLRKFGYEVLRGYGGDPVKLEDCKPQRIAIVFKKEYRKTQKRVAAYKAEMRETEKALNEEYAEPVFDASKMKQLTLF